MSNEVFLLFVILNLKCVLWRSSRGCAWTKSLRPLTAWWKTKGKCPSRFSARTLSRRSLWRRKKRHLDCDVSSAARSVPRSTSCPTCRTNHRSISTDSSDDSSPDISSTKYGHKAVISFAFASSDRSNDPSSYPNSVGTPLGHFRTAVCYNMEF